MKEGKNFSLFLGRSDLIGDTVMAESMLRYFEKIYPNSYKYWHLLGKTSQAAPIWLNHKLIDKIKISKYSESYDSQDYYLMRNCDVTINTRPQHFILDWYNYNDCVSETICMAGIDLDHYKSILTEEERRPTLYRYFDVGLFNQESVGYCKENSINPRMPKNISIQPFCGYGAGLERSPNKEFWSELIEKLIDLDFNVHHYGFVNEPILSDNPRYKKLTHLSFFEQIKACLDSECLISGDSGFGWVIGAYSHKSIYLITNWLPNHKENLLALAPINVNGTNVFYPKGEQPEINNVLEKIKLLI